MKTDFFSKFKNLLENKNAGMSIGMKDEQIIVSVSFQSTTNEDEHSSPIVIKGTPEEMDEGFIDAVTNSMAKIEKVLGLSVNTSALDKQSDEADEEESKKAAKKAESKKKDDAKAYKGKPLDAKAKAGIKKVDEYIKAGKFDNAEVHLKSQCEKFMDHPEVIAKMEEIKSGQSEESEESEESSEENATDKPGLFSQSEETTTSEESEESPEPAKEEPAVKEEPKEPAVKPEPAKEEPKVVSLANAFNQPAVAKQETPKEEQKVETNGGAALKGVISPGFDIEKYKAMNNVDLMKLATDEKGKGNIRKAYDIVLCLLEVSPSHPIAKMRRDEYEKLLNL